MLNADRLKKYVEKRDKEKSTPFFSGAHWALARSKILEITSFPLASYNSKVVFRVCAAIFSGLRSLSRWFL